MSANAVAWWPAADPAPAVKRWYWYAEVCGQVFHTPQTAQQLFHGWSFGSGGLGFVAGGPVVLAGPGGGGQG